MPIKFRCEHCRQLLGISQTKAGQMVDCPTCGRGVRVPSLDGKSDPIAIPKWDPQDQSLVNALSALASLTGESAPAEEPVAFAESVSEDAPSADESSPARDESPKPPPVPTAAAIPEPIQMPPLESPVVLPEPAKSPHPPGPVATEAPQSADEPWAKLATLSDAVPTSPASFRSGSSEGTATPAQPGKGVTLTVALLLVAMAFLLGFFVGNHFKTSPAASSKLARENDVPPQAASIKEPAPATESPHRRAVEGRITYVSATGSSQSDTGAVVILLPAYRNSSTRLPIVGFRPADSSEDREIAKAMVEALGGDLAVVDDRGLYSCDLPQAGEFHLIILSRHLERPETESLDAATRTLLGEYFDRPQQLVGQLNFHVSEVTYRGETTEIRDHTFGRES